MVSALLLQHLRAAETQKRASDKRGLKNRPLSDPARKLIQARQQSGPGQYMLADVLPRSPHPKTQSISPSVLEASRIPYQVQPSVHPKLERLERRLIGAPGTPRVYLRDMTVANEIFVPYDSVLWDKPLNDWNDLHFIGKDAVRPRSLEKKEQQTSPDTLYDYKLDPVVFAIPEPAFGNRLLEPRDSRSY